MSERISVGDLVQVVRGHKCALGFTFVVACFLPQRNGGYRCNLCGARDLGRNDPIGASRDGTHAIPLSWLKRIPPLHELEGEKREEEITA